MSEPTGVDTSATDSTAPEQQPEPQPKPTETVDFWKQKAREQEKRAKENAEAAKRLAELEDANKSEIDKAMDRVTKAEAEVASVPAKVADALRAHLVALHEIPADDAELFLTANDPDLLLKQVTRLVGRDVQRKKQGNHVPREGNTSSAADTPALETVRGLFGG